MEEENRQVETVETTTETTQTAEPTPAPRTYTEEEYGALKTQLESLQQSTRDNEDFKAKWEASEQARKEFEYQTHMDRYVHSLNLVDDVYEEKLSALLKGAGVAFHEGGVTGADETLKAFKERYPQAFKSAKVPHFVDSTQRKASQDDGVLRRIMGLKPQN